ncbi:Crp/Fnr family transcriptional regulator [Aetokthonos hydrillicola Thurmond2011]|jgi:CRP-like cAMP-binding protein|uniref:Crp/Fnr family transcriptional regulator n=1 Tax=Aetokthonos hydrillicola Thurmond2011 TaxID=2712845 RepID=A0AAP5I6Y9_9CYAN|nr:Crp/Fnr family transcriptional regulator [Aetokthonos hydrillicola]MBO3459026.1 Crp/Fnr family transcriptional regulator [Aetokthonos hydrillicola CCALA 1050]MBW4590037.1 Crp/Fnr family transcriptional regulator [Aetokthonos hydrillicola CCALA 1050]MDR9894909.1 Crp/Fnr family transcriptional regulator [Aetokthonos hydrillicola Thurmond2011]
MSLSSPLPTHSSDNVTKEFQSRSLLPLKPNSLWKIETGIVRIVTWHEDGRLITLGIWGPGDIVGKALSKIEPYQIECLSKVEAKILPLHEWYPLTEVLQDHIQQAQELMLIRSHKTVEIMLLKLLGWLVKKFGREVESGHLIDLRLTHQDLAEMLNSNRVTITRLLINLEEQGLIVRLPIHRIVLKEEELWHYEI